MTQEFADHQWQRLAEAGPQIALAVAAAAGSPRQSVAELDAFLRFVDDSADAGTEAVLGRLAVDTRAKIAAGLLTGRMEDAIPDGIHAAREAGAILGVHGDEQEARAIRQWLLRIAHTVASAAREGGFMGVGTKQISDLETETMASIADGLGTTYDATENQADSDAITPGGPDEVGPDGQPIGADNIREGRVRGTMGGPNQTQGEGQGG